jgi:hypothetical protein
MADFHSRESFLRRAPVNDFYLDINNLPKIPKSTSDRLYEIESKYANRPDLLAHELYGTVRLWWVFALRNPDLLIDPLEDFKSGLAIYLPTRETINRVIG